MTRDELAARLFVVLVQELQGSHLENDRHNALQDDDDRMVFSAEPSCGQSGTLIAMDAFRLADAFEAERKRRSADEMAEEMRHQREEAKR